MTPFLGLLLILIIAFVGTRFFGRVIPRKNPFLSGLVVSGIPYILIGVLLGPHFFNFLSNEIISSLESLISLALGWIGLLFGLQLRWHNIRRFPRNYLLFSSLQSLISFLIILSLMGGVFLFLHTGHFQDRTVAVIILAALGSISAPASIAKIIMQYKAKGRLSHFLQFVSSLDSFWGIVIAGGAMTIFHPPAVNWFTSSWHWLLLSLVIGIGLGFLFRFLIKLRFEQEELLLLVLGLVIFTSGIGFYLRLSPIFLTMVVGITLAQFPRESEKVMRVILVAEKPIYLFLLIFAGALWNYRFWEEILLVLAFITIRYLAKYAGGFISARNINCAFHIPQNVGKSLLSFGGVSLAIAFNFQLFYGGVVGDLLMSATILGVFLFDEYTAFATLKILRREGEIQ